MAEINGNLVDAGGSCEKSTERNQIPAKKTARPWGDRLCTDWQGTKRPCRQQATRQNKAKANNGKGVCRVGRCFAFAGPRRLSRVEKSRRQVALYLPRRAAPSRTGQEWPRAHRPSESQRIAVNPANHETRLANDFGHPRTRKLAVRCRVPVYAARWACLQWNEHANRQAVFVIVRPFEAGGAFGRKANHLDVRNNRTC